MNFNNDLTEQYFEGKYKRKELQDVLVAKEKILWQSKPKRHAYVLKNNALMIPIALVFLIFDLFFIAMLIGFSGHGGMMGGMPIFFVVFFAFHLFPVWKLIGGIIKYNRLSSQLIYVITNARIFVYDKSKYYINNFINLNDIQNVELRQSLFDKMRGIGTIVITSKDGTVMFECIKDSALIADKLNDLSSKKVAVEDIVSGGEVQCPHCGGSFDSLIKKCPHCGAPNKKK